MGGILDMEPPILLYRIDKQTSIIHILICFNLPNLCKSHSLQAIRAFTSTNQAIRFK